MNRIVIFLIVAFSACRPLPEVGGAFNSDAWKADNLACKGERLRMVEDVKKAKSQLLDLTESEVRKLLGKPDHVELFSRSQKFYLYYFEPGSQCQSEVGETPAANARMLEVSLDAIGRLHEINIRY